MLRSAVLLVSVMMAGQILARPAAPRNLQIFGNASDPSLDKTGPTVTITAPTSATTYDAGVASSVTLSGTASDASGVAICRATNAATGTTANATTAGNGDWSIAVALNAGSNAITVTCLDPGNNQGTDVLTVTRSSGSLSCTTTVSTSQATVRSAVTAAAAGATVCVQAGSATWSGSNIVEFSNSKGVTLAGAQAWGGGTTTITISGTGTILGMNGTVSGNNTNSYRVTGFTFQGGGACLCLWFWGNGTLNNLRIDHNVFQNLHQDAIAVFFGSTGTTGKVKGVMDNNTFTGSANYMILKYLGPGDAFLWSGSPRGTGEPFYVEDNTLTFTSAVNLSAGCIDIWNAGAVVARFNDSTNCLWTAHGVTHGTTVLFEFYNNNLRRTSGTWQDGTRLWHHQGSLESYVFNNRFFVIGSISGNAIDLTHYRSTNHSDNITGSWCNGSKSEDGNILSNGWPCGVQPGRAVPVGTTPHYGVWAPIYAWNNVNNANGAKVDLAISDPWGVSNPTVADHLQANRDFVNAVSANAQTSPTSPFTGATGMGFGTLANRPTTCTTFVVGTESGVGVGYFATDTNTLYRCTATNTWTAGYTPYTYPHPLRGGS